LTLNGTNQYVTASSAGLPLGSAARTTSLWFNLNSTGVTNVELMSYGSNGGGSRWGMWLGNNDGSCSGPDLGIEAVGFGNHFQWTEDTNWHQLAVTLPSGGTNTTQTLIYFDGVLQTPCNIISVTINTKQYRT
jgi:hypothetical protein